MGQKIESILIWGPVIKHLGAMIPASLVGEGEGFFSMSPLSMGPTRVWERNRGTKVEGGLR